jgi:hypothetical protein
MNCESVRNRFLTLPDPSECPEVLTAHLEGCPSCLAWHQLLLRVEQGVVAAAILPATDRSKQLFIASFLKNAPVATSAGSGRPTKSKLARLPIVAAVVPARKNGSLGEQMARLWPAGLVAAALLVAVVVWSTIGGKPEANSVATLPPDPFLERVVAAKVKLDTAQGDVDRLAALDELGFVIHDEAKTLSKVTPGSDMDVLAQKYELVVATALVAQARDLGADEKKTVLPGFIKRLAEAEQEATKLASEAPPKSVAPLKQIAKAAQDGRVALSRMIQGQGS